MGWRRLSREAGLGFGPLVESRHSPANPIVGGGVHSDGISAKGVGTANLRAYRRKPCPQGGVRELLITPGWASCSN